MDEMRAGEIWFFTIFTSSKGFYLSSLLFAFRQFQVALNSVDSYPFRGRVGIKNFIMPEMAARLLSAENFTQSAGFAKGSLFLEYLLHNRMLGKVDWFVFGIQNC
ncbi:MAG: hypothetical protein LBE85_13075 [Candidatus Accumulibacter sp.]|nr:hypothetical protein [Accumulibacter sp.]